MTTMTQYKNKKCAVISGDMDKVDQGQEIWIRLAR